MEEVEFPTRACHGDPRNRVQESFGGSVDWWKVEVAFPVVQGANGEKIRWCLCREEEDMGVRIGSIEATTTPGECSMTTFSLSSPFLFSLNEPINNIVTVFLKHTLIYAWLQFFESITQLYNSNSIKGPIQMDLDKVEF
ncbi:unnamed protein product [Lactuca saligna]|uniref:Uncharacterized protein n=1 Tax=Lactuca saligna TaxID=75948 RepID=A0AA35VUS8_LACSI|nr:unnamed protein product [Lactuca saligna]